MGEAKASPNHLIGSADYISVVIRSQKSFACIQQYQRIPPWVFQDNTATDLDIERRDDDFAADLFDELRRFISRFDEQVYFLPLLLRLEHQFRFRFGQP